MAMASKINFLLINYLSFVVFLCCVIGKSIALTITLIHVYAPESPFHIANLTDQEIVGKLNFQTRSHRQRMHLVKSSENENRTLLDLQAIRPSLDYEIPLSGFLVKVSLGTFSNGRRSSHKPYYMFLDTGGSTIWMQCEDCKKSENQCFRQMEPPFPNSKSSSYKPLPCNRHPLCRKNRCIGDSCSYHANYWDNSYSIGILAHEVFTFPSNNGHDEIVPLVFGCGINNKLTNCEDHNLKMAGIFGLGWGRLSFITQTHSINNGRFSYCLPSGIKLARGLPSFLRFGSDVPSYSTLPNTNLMQYKSKHFYYVKLLDVSINDVRLNIPSSYFWNGEDSDGGCVFDTGCTITLVSPPVYQIIKDAVKRHIVRYVKNIEIASPLFGYDLCYSTSKPFIGHSNLPFITFHFEGDVNLVVKPDIAFYIGSDDARYDYICLSMVSSDDEKLTVLGSDLQANQFIVYDVFGQKMYFGPQDCSQNR